MSQIPLEWQGIVLAREARGENLCHLRLLTPTDGIRPALVRQSSGSSKGKISASATRLRPPDLWDFLSMLPQPSRKGSSLFAEISELIAHHNSIGSHYPALREASAWSRFLLGHLPEGNHSEDAFAITRKALQAWCQPVDAVLIHLKALFLYAREEGFPVREGWLAQMPLSDRQQVLTLLAAKPSHLPSPSQQQESPASSPLQNLKFWLTQETGGLFRFP